MIFDIEEKESDISYEMDYIGKPNLAEIYLFSRIGHNGISRIFDSIERVFNLFYEKSYISENASWLYSLKLKEDNYK